MTKKEREEIVKVRDFILKNPTLNVVSCVYQALGTEGEKQPWPDWAYEALKRVWGSKALGDARGIFLSIISERLEKEPQEDETLGEVTTTAVG